MILRGKVSSIEINRRARVVFSGQENTVSPLLDIASHVGEISVGDRVVVVFFSDCMTDGIIIAEY